MNLAENLGRCPDLSRGCVRLLLLSCAGLMACGPGKEAAGARLPRIGIAVTDTLGNWCAEFVIDSAMPSLAAGQPVTVLLPGEGPVPGLRGQVNSRKEGECPSAFPQPRWAGYEAFWVTATDSFPKDVTVPSVALIVAGHQPWVRDTSGMVRGDLEGDGQPEEARRCTADEGEHFTVWSLPPGGNPVRRWHEYYDWGGFTDPNCRPEDIEP